MRFTECGRRKVDYRSGLSSARKKKEEEKEAGESLRSCSPEADPGERVHM